MGLKINDIHILKRGARLVIAALNKRGNVKSDYKDVSYAVLDWFVKILSSERGWCRHYISSENKHYKITVREYTAEEIKIIEENNKIKKKNAERKIISFMSLLNRYPVFPHELITKD